MTYKGFDDPLAAVVGQSESSASRTAASVSSSGGRLPMSLRVAGQYGVCLSHTMLVTPDGGVPLTGCSRSRCER